MFSSELFFCAARADVAKVEVYLAAGVDANAEDGTPACNTPLHWAASFRSLSLPVPRPLANRVVLQR